MAKKMMTLEEKLEEDIVSDIPYEVPNSWICTTLGSLVEFERGITFSASEKKNEKGELDIACLRTANVQQKLECDDLIYVDKKHMKSNERKIVREGDILMSTANSLELVGKSVLVPKLFEEMTFGGFILNIRNKGVMNNKFIYYYLRAQYVLGNLQDIASQTTNIANINAKKLGNYVITVPPLKEQQRIVERIESFFEKLDKAKDLIEEAREGFEKRKQSLLEKAFRGKLTVNSKKVEGNFEFNIELDELEETYVKDVESKWNFCRIRDIADVKGGKRLPKGKNLVKENTGYPYLRAGNLKNKSVLEDDIQYLTEDIQKTIKNYTISSNDVYITIVGACIGDVGIIPEKLSGANLTENAAKICNINEEIIDKTFLMKWLSSLTGQYLIKGNILSATLGKLALTRIKEILVPLPSLEEQKEIVRILDKILDEESKIEELTALEEQIELIKKSILAKAFRGELGTNCEEDESALELLKEILNT